MPSQQNTFHQDIPSSYIIAPIRIALKSNQRGENPKLKKGEQTFLFLTHRLNLMHIAINFNQGFPFGFLVIVCIRTALEMNQRDTTQTRKLCL